MNKAGKENRRKRQEMRNRSERGQQKRGIEEKE